MLWIYVRSPSTAIGIVRPFLSYQLAMAAQNGLRLEDADDLAKLYGCSASYGLQFGGDHRNSESFHPGGTHWLMQLTLSDSKLLTEQQDFQALFLLGELTDSDPFE